MFTKQDHCLDSQTKFIGQINVLTSLRLFPALMVLAYHDKTLLTMLSFDTDRICFAQAVAFFFVLSGFILTVKYSAIKTKKEILSFYLARFARIWPAHAFTLLLLIVLLPEVFKVRFSDIPILLANLFLFHSWIPIWKVFFSYNAASWSNATEMFFYLCFPILAILSRGRWQISFLVGAAGTLLSICFANTLNLPEFVPTGLSSLGIVFIHPFARLLEFATGMTAGEYFLHRHRDLVARKSIRSNKSSKIHSLYIATSVELIAIAMVAFINLNSTIWRYASLQWAGNAGGLWIQNSGLSILGFAILILIFSFEVGLVSKFLTLTPFVFLGELSFGLYMIHGVILSFESVNWLQEDSLQNTVLFFGVCFLSAHLMYLLVERPARKMILKCGHGLIEREKAQPEIELRPVILQSFQEKSFLKIKTQVALVLAEVCMLACFICQSVHTIHPLSQQVVSSLKNNLINLNSNYGDALRHLGIGTSIHSSGRSKNLVITLLWQNLHAQSLGDNFVTVEVRNGMAKLGHKSYIQDPRNWRLESGTAWTESISIPIEPFVEFTTPTISISLKKKRRCIAANTFDLPLRIKSLPKGSTIP